MEFAHLVAFCKLTQYNTIKNKHGNMLDLVLSSLGSEYVLMRHAGPLVPEDAHHPALGVTLSVPRSAGRALAPCLPPAPASTLHDSPPQWNFRKANFEQLYHSIGGLSWDEVLETNDVDKAVNIFYRKLHDHLRCHVPVKKQRKFGSRYQYPTWYTPEIIQSIRMKYTYLKKSREVLNNEYYISVFKFYRQHVKSLIKLAYDSYIKRAEMDIRRDPKSFWSFVKEQRSSRQSCSEYEYEDEIVTGVDAVNAFANYFKSVFLPDKPLLSHELAERGEFAESSSRIALDNISSKDLLLAVKRLKPRSSTGPDGIPPFIVKDCIAAFMVPLVFIFNLAIETACYPSLWKLSRVTPIHKDGSRSHISNYRPIAVLSAFGKLFESILNRHITRQIRPLLSECQHGFRAGRSTATNLVNLVDYAVTEMDRNRQVDAAYFDFKKAFDRVHNDVLLNKFSAIGFTPKLLKLFCSYFADRRQYVQLAGYRSDTYITQSGVSQGSTLGPTQFLVMVNDLPEVVRTAECLMFADDLKIYLGVGTAADCDALQRDINNVVAWSNRNRLEFNKSKCKTITFSRCRSPHVCTYSASGTPLERVAKIRDLGVLLDTELTFNDHITALCQRAHKSLGFVLRQSARFTSKHAIVALYFAFVRSRLEFNSIVWDPHKTKYNLLLERVQRKFCRYLYKKMYGYYPYLYPSLFVSGMVGIDTLELRRKCALLLHYFLLLNGKIDNTPALSRFGLSAPDQYTRLRSRPLLAAPRVRTRTAQYAATNQAVTLLNTLTAQHPEVDIFHSNIRIFLIKCKECFST